MNNKLNHNNKLEKNKIIIDNHKKKSVEPPYLRQCQKAKRPCCTTNILLRNN